MGHLPPLFVLATLPHHQRYKIHGLVLVREGPGGPWLVFSDDLGLTSHLAVFPLSFYKLPPGSSGDALGLRQKQMLPGHPLGPFVPVTCGTGSQVPAKHYLFASKVDLHKDII